MKIKALARKFTILTLAAIVLAGCGAMPNSQPSALPTVVLNGGAPSTGAQTAKPASTLEAPSNSDGAVTGFNGSGVTASGNVVPAQQAEISSGTGGNVLKVTVVEGDKVKAGQVLVTFAGSEKLTAAVQAANVQLITAQQALQSLNDNADKMRSDAQLRVANAAKALDDAQKRRTWKQYRNGAQTSIDTAKADVILAKHSLEDAQKIFNSVADRDENDINRAGPLSGLAAAQVAYDKAVANLNYLLGMPNELDVNQAEAVLRAAQSEYNNALVAYNKLKNGPDPDALTLAQANIANAQAQLAASQSALADLELKAPFDSTVSVVNITSGEWVTPGQPVLLLANVDQLRVETTDLSERDVPKVAVGQPVSVMVKALNQEVKGKVTQIDVLAQTLGGDVVYKTFIALDTLPKGLHAGMSVDVQFGK